MIIATWVVSDGGPLLLLEQSNLSQWGGVEINDGAVATWGDYGRACVVEGYIGEVPVGSRTALVLGDLPVSTTYIADERLFLRWVAGDSEADVLAAAMNAVADGIDWGHDFQLIWRVDGPVVLFDSAWPGDGFEAVNSLVIDLAPGDYGVRASYVEDSTSMMILIQLDPVPNV